MLAELAACNAAFDIIKAVLANGKELYDCADATKDYFDNKSSVAKRVATKGKGDLDAFMALEKIKEQEEWLKDYMVYAGRPGMWDDWLYFQAQAKQERVRVAKAAILKRNKTIQTIQLVATIIGVVVGVVPVLIYGVMLLAAWPS